MKNQTLVIIFGVLLIIYLGSRFLGGDRERSFNPDIVSLDTAGVTRIVVTPKDTARAAFTLQRNGNEWTLAGGTESYRATSSSVRSLLQNLVGIRAERVISKDPDKWSDYDVNEEGGTRIQVFQGDRLNTDLIVGRFNFNQMTRSGSSYVRLADESNVYAVDGFLSMSLSQDMDNYRNKTVAKLSKENLTRITLQSPESAAFYQRDSTGWTDESGLKMDSSSMESYLNTLQSINGVNFADGFNAEQSTLVSQLMIEGNNMDDPLRIHCWASQDTLYDFVIKSSINEEGYFTSDTSGIYNRLFGKFHEIRN